jgi:tRNA pseudouridine 55 synthase
MGAEKVRRHGERKNLHGIILLDKPTGITSNEALQIVKRLYRAHKAGHTGSLDALASGLLPVCLGEATKVSRFLLNADKHYRVTCRLGQRTETGDAEGKILETRPVENIDPPRLLEVLGSFTGNIQQIPPMYSALKYQGQRLYALARKGIEVERQARAVTIHELSLVRADRDRVELEVRCSKGTYIRTLAEDIGEALGCGAHVIALRRLGVGPYEMPEMTTIDKLRRLAEEGPEHIKSVLLPIESALRDWPGIRLSDDAAYYMRQGQAVLVPHAPSRGWVRLYQGTQRFLGMGQILGDGRVAPRRLINQH